MNNNTQLTELDEGKKISAIDDITPEFVEKMEQGHREIVRRVREFIARLGNE